MENAKQLDWCCVCACNKPEVLATNLAASPDLVRQPSRLNVQHNPPSSSLAYLQGMQETSAEIVVFAHQDVYLPDGWADLLAQRLQQLEQQDPDWAVAGLFGVGLDGKHHGHCSSTGLARELGGPFEPAIPAASLDEMLLVLKRSSGLCFDAELPDFHLYGTDIVLSAQRAGLAAYVIHAPAVHNSTPVRGLGSGFTAAYRFMKTKWSDRLPVQTLITRIEQSEQSLDRAKEQLATRKTRKTVRRMLRIAAQNWRWLFASPDPAAIARHFGYEKD